MEFYKVLSGIMLARDSPGALCFPTKAFLETGEALAYDERISGQLRAW